MKDYFKKVYRGGKDIHHTKSLTKKKGDIGEVGGHKR